MCKARQRKGNDASGEGNGAGPLGPRAGVGLDLRGARVPALAVVLLLLPGRVAGVVRNGRRVAGLLCSGHGDSHSEAGSVDHEVLAALHSGLREVRLQDVQVADHLRGRDEGGLTARVRGGDGDQEIMKGLVYILVALIHREAAVRELLPVLAEVAFQRGLVQPAVFAVIVQGVQAPKVGVPEACHVHTESCGPRLEGGRAVNDRLKVIGRLRAVSVHEVLQAVQDLLRLRFAAFGQVGGPSGGVLRRQVLFGAAAQVVGVAGVVHQAAQVVALHLPSRQVGVALHKALGEVQEQLLVREVRGVDLRKEAAHLREHGVQESEGHVAQTEVLLRQVVVAEVLRLQLHQLLLGQGLHVRMDLVHLVQPLLIQLRMEPSRLLHEAREGPQRLQRLLGGLRDLQQRSLLAALLLPARRQRGHRKCWPMPGPPPQPAQKSQKQKTCTQFGGGGVGHGTQGWARKTKERSRKLFLQRRGATRRAAANMMREIESGGGLLFKGAPASQRTRASGRTRDAPGAKSSLLGVSHPNTSTYALPPTCAHAQASMASSGRDPLRERDNVHHQLIPCASQRWKKLGKLGHMKQTEEEEEEEEEGQEEDKVEEACKDLQHAAPPS